MSDPRASTAAAQIAELKVSGQTMALDPGLYCIFSAPGGGAPDPSTGLPIVWIGAAPGVRPGRIKTVGLEADGWIGPNSATLVRVSEERSDLLVTVYQAPDSRVNAPSIQVLRLGGDEPAAVPGPVAAQQARPQGTVMEVVGHIYGRGDVGSMLGAWAGEPGSKRWIEGFAVAPAGDVPASDIEYQAVLGRGWLSPWSEGGQFCGSRGMSLPILGLRVRLRGASAATHRVSLVASFVDGTQIGPVGDAEACEAPSLAALEAFQLSFEAVAAAKPAAKASSKPAATKPAAPKQAAAKKATPTKPAATKVAAKATKTAAPKPAAPKPAAPKPAAPKTVAAEPITPKPIAPAASPPARRAPAGRRR